MLVGQKHSYGNANFARLLHTCLQEQIELIAKEGVRTPEQLARALCRTGCALSRLCQGIYAAAYTGW